ncbi:MAG: hypothetical protein A2X78_04610 [Gammaproteobacteria bacterium GWE2_37_16]|nr:MAG: hypothetical protein A2X78_04610 [Gammaproteobacteria bacterium GWE2_37_16]
MNNTPLTTKKPKKKRIRTFLKNLFNVKRWIAADQIYTFGKMIRHGSKGMFDVPEAKHHETFDDAVQRLGLTEEDIAKKTKQFFFMACIYAFFSVCALFYAVYLIAYGYYLSTLLSLVLTMFIGSNALREHFWYMQMQQRKLGCNLQDWMRFVFNLGAQQ